MPPSTPNYSHREAVCTRLAASAFSGCTLRKGGVIDCVKVPHNCANSSSEAQGFSFFSKVSLGVKKNLMLDIRPVLRDALFQTLFVNFVMIVKQNLHGKRLILLSQHVYFCQLQLTRIEGNRC